jgi:hypothetical protein
MALQYNLTIVATTNVPRQFRNRRRPFILTASGERCAQFVAGQFEHIEKIYSDTMSAANYPLTTTQGIDPQDNKSTAFTEAEREELRLTGLPPAGVDTEETQIQRALPLNWRAERLWRTKCTSKVVRDWRTLMGVDWLLPAVLSTTAGAVDVIGFLALGGLFTAHITGNLVVLAAHYVTGRFSQVGPLLSVPVFVLSLGALTLVFGTAYDARALRRVMLILHAALLGGFLVLGVALGPFADASSATSVLVGMLGVAAMATQNAPPPPNLPKRRCWTASSCAHNKCSPQNTYSGR